MNLHINRIAPTAALIALGLIAVACSSTRPSRFYLLGVTPDTAPALTNLAARTFAVLPVEIASYLNRPQMVTVLPTGRLELAEYDRWAEPLQDSLRRAVIARLRARLPSCRFDAELSTDVKQDRLQIRVSRFDADKTGLCRMDAEWTLRAVNGEVRFFRPALDPAQAEGPGVESRLAALNLLAVRLADAIAAQIAAP